MFGTYTVEAEDDAEDDAEDEAESSELASEAALPEGDYAKGSFRVMDIEEKEMKYRVHTFQVYRLTYEVEADSADDAKRMVDETGWDMQPVECVSTEEWLPDMIVDPISPDGSVDYESVTYYPQGELK